VTTYFKKGIKSKVQEVVLGIDGEHIAMTIKKKKGTRKQVCSFSLPLPSSTILHLHLIKLPALPSSPSPRSFLSFPAITLLPSSLPHPSPEHSLSNFRSFQVRAPPRGGEPVHA
jgi:hypothetical protein